ncbi:MAG TPA: hypothetical protein PK620_05825 [Denitromonas sp.]|uniref:hypothetical protein n=1 Tax=Denitromonas sp. TaxID=2734609 RepID=UPI001D6E1947|nr:hypothetical protein [Rhodocyclaceae bacterium]MCP5222828.1 hypothetical protein [Zoogloeaceae bacterium]HPR06068.1 hypothetical protein [Denitromonas sp.]HQU88257.1 hypothetical protein [Denitromonas sp.]HQV14413.1 hypothetical protein [Denitromonas sp.]
MNIQTFMRRLTLVSLFGLLSVGANAQERPLEEIGIIKAVSPAASTIVVGDRKLKITTATKVTADDRSLAYSPVSSAWVGKQIAMETNPDGQGNILVVELHLFSGGSGQ